MTEYLDYEIAFHDEWGNAHVHCPFCDKVFKKDGVIMHIKRSPNHGDNTLRSWTKREEDILRECYPKKGASWCAKHINRTELAVKTKASLLGLKLEDEAKLRTKKKLVPCHKCKKSISRSKASHSKKYTCTDCKAEVRRKRSIEWSKKKKK